jgi:O-antigen/teichoic acid export membrane protein
MVAVQFSLAASIILDSINKALSPWLFNILNENSYQEKIKVVKVTYGLYFLIGLGVLVSFFASDPLVKFIVGKDFVEAAKIVPFLVLGQGLRGMYLLVTNYMFYAKRTGLISSITISAGFLNVVLLFFLIDKFGIFGAAYSFIISMIFQWLVTWYFASKNLKMPWFNIYSKKN